MPTHTKTKQKHAMSLLTFAQDKLRQARTIKENQFGVFTLGLYAADLIHSLLIQALEQNHSQKPQSVRSGMFNSGEKGSLARRWLRARPGARAVRRGRAELT